MKAIYWGVISIILALGVFLLLLHTKKNTSYSAQEFIQDIKEKNKYGLDSLQNAINYENNLNARIKASIDKGDFEAAFLMMDSLPTFGKRATIHLYRGMIYLKQKRYRDAINEYNTAIKYEPYPATLSKRAEVYKMLNKFDSALTDYKSSYVMNHYYSFQVASVFELMGKADSALRYYQIYASHYPSDTIVSQKIRLLTSK